jgi:hypothetical protein
MYALVEATDNSLPQLIKTPQSFSLASVELTLFTTFIRFNPISLASLNGFSKSIVSPDCDTQSRAAYSLFLNLKSSGVISEAAIACTYSKQPS